VIWRGAAAALLAIAGLPVDADPFCDDLNAVADQVGGAALTYAQRPAICRPSLAMSGARHLHCSWKFPYRSAAAIDAFDLLTAKVAACVGPNATKTKDQSVNHPDAYQLRQFNLDGREFAVSLKDKGALQQTLVFVRVQLR